MQIHTKTRSSLLMILVCLMGAATLQATVQTYTAPTGTAASPTYQVSADGQPVFVYHIVKAERYNSAQAPQSDIANFSFSDSVTIRVRVLTPFSTVAIRPSSLGIIPAISGDTIRFTLKRQAYLSLELNGDTKHPLLIFADTTETGIPTANDPAVRYFAGGTVHELGDTTINAVDGKTLYLAGGSIVKGSFTMTASKNITIRGRGILIASPNVPLWAYDCDRIIIDGPIVIQENDTCALQWIRARDSKIRNAKFISTKGEGIDLSNSQRCAVDRSFIFGMDDVISLKGDTYWGQGDSTTNDTVLSCVVWDGGAGSGLEIGREMFTTMVKNCLFKNIDIIHNELDEKPFDYYYTVGAISIHDGGPRYCDGYVSNIRYESIRIEDCREQFLFDFTVPSMNPFNNPATEGNRSISGIVLKDVSVTGGPFPGSLMQGMNNTRCVQNITFDGLTVLGKPILNAASLKLQSNGSVRNVVFTAGAGTVPAAPESLSVVAGASPGSVALQWKDNSATETSFIVERAGGSDTGFSIAALIAANGSSATVSGLLYATEYRFRVQACNGAGSSVFSNSVTITTGPGPTAPATQDLRWRFNGSGAEDGGGPAAALVSGALISKDAREGSGSLELTGSSGAEAGVVQLGDTFTITLWEKQPYNGGNWNVLACNGVRGFGFKGFAFSVNSVGSSLKALYLETGNGTDLAVARSTYRTMNVGQWYHAAVVVDRKAGIARFYLDGVDITDQGSVRTDFRVDTMLRLGSTAQGSGFIGLVDDVRIYKRLLPPSEVTALASVKSDAVSALHRVAIAPHMARIVPRSVIRLDRHAGLVMSGFAGTGVRWVDGRGRIVNAKKAPVGIYFSNRRASQQHQKPR